MQITNPLRFLIVLMVFGAIISICNNVDPFTGEPFDNPKRTRISEAKDPSCDDKNKNQQTDQIIYERLTFISSYPVDERYQEILIVTSDGCNTVNLSQTRTSAETRQSLQLGVPMEADPAWSPDRKKVAFASSRGTYYHGTLGTFEHEGSIRPGIVVEDIGVVPNNEIKEISLEAMIDRRLSYGSQPSWSPDGEKLAFTLGENYSERGDIYTINIDGTNRVRITETLSNASHPDWSPDGTRMAFVLSDPLALTSERVRIYNYEADIYVMDTKGSNIRRLTDSKLEDYLTEVQLGVLKQSSPRWGCCNSHSYAPSWSPDGNKIAFVLDTVIKNHPDFASEFMDFLGEQPIPGVTSGIYIMDPDGGNLTFLTEAELVPRQEGSERQRSRSLSGPTWSPDGSRIAFEDMGDIYTINIDGTNRVRITNTDEYESNPDWSP